MFKFGKVYKLLFDMLRSSDQLTYLIFGIRIWERRLNTNWDVTTLVLKKAVDKYIKDYNKKVLDMGCGHIALIAQYIKKNNQTNYVLGVDIYKDFIENAIFNANKNSIEINFKQSNLYSNIKGKFDFIIFNPPYVPTKSLKTHYPKSSFSGNDGFYTIKKFLFDSKKYLSKDGIILLGINCFYLKLDQILHIIEKNGYALRDIVSRKFNTAKVFVLSLK